MRPGEKEYWPAWKTGFMILVAFGVPAGLGVAFGHLQAVLWVLGGIVALPALIFAGCFLMGQAGEGHPPGDSRDGGGWDWGDGWGDGDGAGE